MDKYCEKCEKIMMALVSRAKPEVSEFHCPHCKISKFMTMEEISYHIQKKGVKNVGSFR
jgi:hypothetical protein